MNPFQIGVVTIAGSPVALSTLTGVPTRVRTLLIENLGAGPVYLGAAGMNISTLAGVVLVIPAGQNRSIGGVTQNNIVDWTVYSLHGSNPGDLVLLTGQTV